MSDNCLMCGASIPPQPDYCDAECKTNAGLLGNPLLNPMKWAEAQGKSITAMSSESQVAAYAYYYHKWQVRNGK